MADIVFDCGHCGGALVVEETGAGLELPCPQCGKAVTIPRPAQQRFEVEPKPAPGPGRKNQAAKLGGMATAKAVADEMRGRFAELAKESAAVKARTLKAVDQSVGLHKLAVYAILALALGYAVIANLREAHLSRVTF